MRRRLNVVDKLGAAWNFTASAGRAPVRASVNRVLAARADHAREVRMRHGHGLGHCYFGRSSQIVIVWHGSGLAMLSPMVCVSQEAGGQKRSRVGSPELSFCVGAGIVAHLTLFQRWTAALGSAPRNDSDPMPSNQCTHDVSTARNGATGGNLGYVQRAAPCL